MFGNNVVNLSTIKIKYAYCCCTSLANPEHLSWHNSSFRLQREHKTIVYYSVIYLRYNDLYYYAIKEWYCLIYLRLFNINPWSPFNEIRKFFNFFVESPILWALNRLWFCFDMGSLCSLCGILGALWGWFFC